MPMSEWVRALRDVIGHDLVVMVGAAAIVTDDAGNILLQQRTDNGLWGLPGGGIEPGEEPAQAAIREVYEETGLHVEAVQIIGIFGGKSQIRSYPGGDRFAYISMTFECRVIGGELAPDNDESQDVRWFAPDNIPAEFVDVHRRRIEAWQQGNLPYFAMPSSDVPPVIEANYIRQLRQRIGNLMIMMPGCNAVVFNDAGEILVQQRRDDGLWNLPGGIYKVGDEPSETAVRETYKETGLLVKPVRLVGVYGGEEFLYTYPSGDQFAFIDSVFACEIIGGTLKSQSDECLAHRFVSPDQLPEPFMDKHRQLIEHALNRHEPFFAS